MSCCEKCWKDARGDSEKYSRLINERIKNPCSPEQQAGDDAEICPLCISRLNTQFLDMRTVHQHTGECMMPNCGYRK